MQPNFARPAVIAVVAVAAAIVIAVGIAGAVVAACVRAQALANLQELKGHATTLTTLIGAQLPHL